MIVRQVEFARWLAKATGSTVESCQVKISQWISAGHIEEGRGLEDRDGVPFIDCSASAPHHLLARLDSGQAQGNAAATIAALRRLALMPEAIADEATAVALAAGEVEDPHSRRTKAQAELLEANARKAQMANERLAGTVVDRLAAEAAMTSALTTELSSQERWLQDVAAEVAGAVGAEPAAVLKLLMDSNNRRRRTLVAEAEAVVAAAMQQQTLRQTEAAEAE